MVVPKRMADANEDVTEKRPSLTLTRTGGGTTGGRLELKARPVEAGQVRQSFSHGRSKTVQVEVRKKRVFTPGAPEPTPPPAAAPAPTQARAPQPAAAPTSAPAPAVAEPAA